MLREEFSKFMKKQIFEIKRYTEKRLNSDKNCDGNACVFEWIECNAKAFSDKWKDNKK